jgi:spore germination cell wall hydrolase CwlJ-like protein
MKKWILLFVMFFVMVPEIVPEASTATKNPPADWSQWETLRSYTAIADQVQVECLAKNIYFEARNQKLVSRIAVGLVTLNRVEDELFPPTICGVITEAQLWKGKPVRDACQFSWYCDGKSDVPKNLKAWNKAFNLAINLYTMKNYHIFDFTYGATHYHATYVNPKWAKKLKRTAQFEMHIFYKMEK